MREKQNIRKIRRTNLHFVLFAVNIIFFFPGRLKGKSSEYVKRVIRRRRRRNETKNQNQKMKKKKMMKRRRERERQKRKKQNKR